MKDLHKKQLNLKSRAFISSACEEIASYCIYLNLQTTITKYRRALPYKGNGGSLYAALAVDL